MCPQGQILCPWRSTHAAFAQAVRKILQSGKRLNATAHARPHWRHVSLVRGPHVTSHISRYERIKLLWTH